MTTRVPLTLHQLEAFVRVARTLSFRKAAEALHVSQPALSRTVSGAEEALGARLFDRDTRNVRLTVVGTQLLPVATRVLGEFESSLSELSGLLAGHRGRIVVATLPSVGASLLPAAIAEFAGLYPDVEFEIRVTTTKPVLAFVDAGEADFGICMEPLPERNFHYDHLLDDEFVLVCAAQHSLAERSHWEWDVFAKFPYIALSKGTSIRMSTEAVFEDLGMVVLKSFECGSLPVGARLIAAGLGITAWPRHALSQTDVSGLAVRALSGPTLSRRLGIVTRVGRTPSRASNNFLRLLKEQVSRMRTNG